MAARRRDGRAEPSCIAGRSAGLAGKDAGASYSRALAECVLPLCATGKLCSTHIPTHLFRNNACEWTVRPLPRPHANVVRRHTRVLKLAHLWRGRRGGGEERRWGRTNRAAAACGTWAAGQPVAAGRQLPLWLAPRSALHDSLRHFNCKVDVAELPPVCAHALPASSRAAASTAGQVRRIVDEQRRQRRRQRRQQQGRLGGRQAAGPQLVHGSAATVAICCAKRLERRPGVRGDCRARL